MLEFSLNELIQMISYFKNAHKSYPQVMWITLVIAAATPSTLKPNFCTGAYDFRMNKPRKYLWLSQATKDTIFPRFPTRIPHLKERVNS